MTGERSIHIGHDANNNVIVTGDDNRVYVFPGITQFTAELIAHIEAGTLKPQDAPGAVPLPMLTLRIAFANAARSTWNVISIPVHVLPNQEHGRSRRNGRCWDRHKGTRLRCPVGRRRYHL